MAWDKTKPGGSDTFPPSDNAIRDNWTFIEAALQTISTFAVNPSDPTQITVKIRYGLLASRPASGETTGAVYMASDTGQLFIWSGAAWVELTKFGTALTVAAALTVSGALAANGLISANAGLTLPSGQVITIPASGNPLTDGSNAFHPHAHQGRHNNMASGLTGNQLDYLGWLLKNLTFDVSAAGDLVTDALTNDTTNMITRTINMSSRRAAGVVLVVGIVTLNGETATSNCEATLAVDAVSPTATTSHFARVSAVGDYRNIVCAELFTGLSAASHEFKFRAKGDAGAGNAGKWVNAQLFCLDFGPST